MIKAEPDAGIVRKRTVAWTRLRSWMPRIFYAAFTRNLQPRPASPLSAEVDPDQRACVLTWGRPINGRTHNEKSTRMHRHAGLWHHPLSRPRACPVGKLSVWYLLAGMGPRRIRRNSASRDNHRSAVTFRNETSIVARDGKFVVRARAFLVAGSRAWRCGRAALDRRSQNPLRVALPPKADVELSADRVKTTAGRRMAATTRQQTGSRNPADNSGARHRT
jgi:hypothetical protein